MSNEQLMDKLASAVSYKYREDKTAPGITVSRLKNGFYCSIVRYNGAFAKGKVIVCSARADNYSAALKEVAQKFLVQQAKDPVQELGELVKSV